MIDTIKLKIYGKFDLEAFSQRKDSIFNPESGEITVEKGILQNLKLNYFHRTETLIVEESLKKFMFGEDSIKDLYYADIFTARDKIKDKLGLTDEQIDFAEVIRLDLGINILVDRPAEDYLDIINSHPKLKRVEYPTSVSFIGKKKKIIFYDKYQELLDKKVIKKKMDGYDANLLRFEVQYRLVSGVRGQLGGLKTFKDVLQSLDFLWGNIFEEFNNVRFESIMAYSLDQIKLDTYEVFGLLLLHSYSPERINNELHSLVKLEIISKDQKYRAILKIKDLCKKINFEEIDLREQLLQEIAHKLKETNYSYKMMATGEDISRLLYFKGLQDFYEKYNLNLSSNGKISVERKNRV